MLHNFLHVTFQVSYHSSCGRQTLEVLEAVLHRRTPIASKTGDFKLVFSVADHKWQFFCTFIARNIGQLKLEMGKEKASAALFDQLQAAIEGGEGEEIVGKMKVRRFPDTSS